MISLSKLGEITTFVSVRNRWTGFYMSAATLRWDIKVLVNLAPGFELENTGADLDEIVMDAYSKVKAFYREHGYKEYLNDKRLPANSRSSRTESDSR